MVIGKEGNSSCASSSANCLATFGTQTAPCSIPICILQHAVTILLLAWRVAYFCIWASLLNSWMALIFRRSWLFPWLLSILRDDNVSLWGRDSRLCLKAVPGHRVGAKLSIQGNLPAHLALRVCFRTASDKLGEDLKLIWVHVGGIARGQKTFATGGTLHHGSMKAPRANVIIGKMLH